METGGIKKSAKEHETGKYLNDWIEWRNFTMAATTSSFKE
jgi:hypothetical protein